MPQVEITPQYVNAPKPGKKYGSVKTAEGLRFVAKPAVLGQLGPGIVANISYHVETWGQEQVQVIDAKTGGAAPPTLVPLPSTPTQTPVRARTAPADSKQIFVTALLGRALQSGKLEFSKTAVVSAGNAMKDAYEELFGSPKVQETQAIMDDEIPFERYNK